jgi:hypothetical protein
MVQGDLVEKEELRLMNPDWQFLDEIDFQELARSVKKISAVYFERLRKSGHPRVDTNHPDFNTKAITFNFTLACTPIDNPYLLDSPPICEAVFVRSVALRGDQSEAGATSFWHINEFIELADQWYKEEFPDENSSLLNSPE